MDERPKVLAEQGPPDDLQAQNESRAFAKQELENDRQRQEHARQEKLRSLFA